MARRTRRGGGGAAAKLFQKACDQDEALGCTNLAVLYDKGEAVAVDHARAVGLLTRACDLGNLQSCFVAGYRLKEGSNGTSQHATAAA